MHNSMGKVGYLKMISFFSIDIEKLAYSRVISMYTHQELILETQEVHENKI